MDETDSTDSGSSGSFDVSKNAQDVFSRGLNILEAKAFQKIDNAQYRIDNSGNLVNQGTQQSVGPTASAMTAPKTGSVPTWVWGIGAAAIVVVLVLALKRA